MTTLSISFSLRAGTTTDTSGQCGPDVTVEFKLLDGWEQPWSYSRPNGRPSRACVSSLSVDT